MKVYYVDGPGVRTKNYWTVKEARDEARRMNYPPLSSVIEMKVVGQSNIAESLFNFLNNDRTIKNGSERTVRYLGSPKQLEKWESEDVA